MIKVGMYIADRYEVIGKIGAGGMSDVYKAKDHILGRFIAIKVLKPEFSEDMNFVTKFRTEAQSAAGLEHPNIVNIYDVGSENRMHFIVMEYVEGITLKTYIEKKGQLSFKEAVSIAIQVARGIEAAHNKHIIHRDIKPQNIIISTDGKVKVTDFGIARAASANTISADVMGSVHYASPEQARNGFVDGRSDIYSLGIVMYEMVTGRVPFDGDTTVAVAIQHLQEEMPSPQKFAQDLPISLEKIILKCTQKNPDRRYQTIGELLTDLRQSLATPNENFVVMFSPGDNGKTKVIASGGINTIPVEGPESEEEPEEESEVEESEEDEDEYDDEEEGRFLNPKMEKAVTVMGIMIAVLIVAVIIYVIVSVVKFLNPGSAPHESGQTEIETPTKSESESESESDSEERFEMINIVGKNYDEAEELLRELGLTLSVKEVRESEEFETDQIMEQDVDEGIKVKAGDVIGVVVCGDETEAVLVPGVEGELEADAISKLEAENLIPDKYYDYSDTIEAGRVISQLPTGGSSVTEGTTVKIIISQGMESIKVPSVVGSNGDVAVYELEAAGLTVIKTEEYDSGVEAGKVISQSIDGGKLVPKNSEISIVVSLGAEVVYYSLSYDLKIPDGVDHAVIELKDGSNGSGNTLASWGTKENPASVTPGGTFNISKNGLKAPTGSVSYTWYKTVPVDVETPTEVPVIDPETGQPVIDPATGQPQTTEGTVTTQKTELQQVSAGSENVDQYFKKQE